MKKKKNATITRRKMGRILAVLSILALCLNLAVGYPLQASDNRETRSQAEVVTSESLDVASESLSSESGNAACEALPSEGFNTACESVSESVASAMDEEGEDHTAVSANRTEPQHEDVVEPAAAPARAVSEEAEREATGQEATESESTALEASGTDASSHFHATMTLNKETYASGVTAICNVRYTIDPGSIKAGDTITVSIPQDVASGSRLSVSPQHFSGVADNGDGTYTLTFGEGAAAALTGSFTIYITTADVTEKTTRPVTTGGASVDLTVLPRDNSAPTGPYTDALMKDASENDFVSYGDYDYSEGYGDSAAQIGIYDSTEDKTVKYRLYVNDKKAEMNNVRVVDTLPDGMTFVRENGVEKIEVTDRESGATIDPSLYTCSFSGNTMTFAYPGTLDRQTIQINYWVKAKGGPNVRYTNRATVSYTSDGQEYEEDRRYVLQGNNYTATSGEKSVDKTVISSDPDDQWVTYTIKFWDNNGYTENEINLDDKLDSHVKFLYAETNDKFAVTYDEAAHTVHMTNTTSISSNDTEYVRFVVDFSDVPMDYTVENCVNGGNTTKTFKMPELDLTAEKTVDGEIPAEGQTFNFQLLDADGNVLQEKQNEGETIKFDSIYYTEDDIGKTFAYTVKEVVDGGSDGYTCDPAVYTVTVTPTAEYDGDGFIRHVALEEVISKNDGSSESSVANIHFNNEKKGYELPLTGGTGTFRYIGSGILLISSAALLYIYMMSHERRKYNEREL